MYSTLIISLLTAIVAVHVLAVPQAARRELPTSEYNGNNAVEFKKRSELPASEYNGNNAVEFKKRSGLPPSEYNDNNAVKSWKWD